MEELQSHEKQFNDVQDRGEEIVRQKAIGGCKKRKRLYAFCSFSEKVQKVFISDTGYI